MTTSADPFAAPREGPALWSRGAVVLTAVALTPGPAAVLVAIGHLRAGEPGRAALVAAAGLAGSALCLAVGALAPGLPAGAFYMVAALAAALLLDRDAAALERRVPGHRRASNAWPVAIALLLLLSAWCGRPALWVLTGDPSVRPASMGPAPDAPPSP